MTDNTFPRTPEEIFDFLMGAVDYSNLPSEQFLKYLGILIDLSLDLRKDAGLHFALQLSGELEKQDLNTQQLTLLHYFRSNAWANLRDLPTILARDANLEIQGDAAILAWEWEQKETEKQILHLRLALKEDGFNTLPQERQCQILTNLANLYDVVGRFVEAIELWGRAISIDQSFGMAYGNRAIGFIHYAYTLYDPGHRIVFLNSALADLEMALATELHPDARKSFDRKKTEIETSLSPDAKVSKMDLNKYSLGQSKNEVHYKQWCLENCLFLNPLNDLGVYPIAARDILTAPDMVYGLKEGPYYHGFFGQMKQEFVSARYLYYEGIKATSPHFSDKDVLLYNTLDYPVYSLAVEKIKAAYRITYSILDKIAYFLNAYLRLSIPERRVSFRTFWYNNARRELGLRTDFEHRPNWPLRGLFWLGKDLFEDKPGFKDSTTPDAQLLADIRNHLEHKYLKIHDDLWWGTPGNTVADDKESDDLLFLKDSLAFSLRRRDFIDKTHRLLKMTRAALVYLSLAIHQEERQRQERSASKEIVVGQPLDVWKDDWKI